MTRLTLFLTLPVLALLPSCASAVSGSTQTVTIETPGSYATRCILQNGNRYKADNGVPVTIMRSEKDLIVDCYGSDNRNRKIVVKSELSDWSVGNVATGVVPGVAYDHVSKALYAYPEIITVDFIGVPGRGYELPQYHDKDMPNPYDTAIEPYAPSVPEVPSDNGFLKRGVEKRTPNSDGNPFLDPSAPTAPVGGGSVTPMPGAVSGQMSGGSQPQPVLKGTTADELTRSMNPSVFAPK